MKQLSINGKPRKKCFCKKCSDCNFYMDWNVKYQNGLEAVEDKCSFDCWNMAIPGIIGSVDGAQQAANESRNYVLALARGLAVHGLNEPVKILYNQIKEQEQKQKEISNGNQDKQARGLLEG